MYTVIAEIEDIVLVESPWWDNTENPTVPALKVRAIRDSVGIMFKPYRATIRQLERVVRITA